MDLKHINSILLLVSILLLSSCVTRMQTYSFKFEKIEYAYMDSDENLYVCTKGIMLGEEDGFSEITIVIPLSKTELEMLERESLYNPIGPGTDFYDSEILGFAFSPKWLRQGCVNRDDMANMRPIPVVSDLIPVKPSEITENIHLSPQSHEARMNATNAYLKRMKPGNSGTTLYQLRDTEKRYLPALIYVTTTPHFGQVNKIGFSIDWQEEHFSPKDSAAAVLGVPIVGSAFVIGGLLGPLPPPPEKEDPLKNLSEDEKKQRIALEAAKVNKCPGEITRLFNEPPEWDHPSERAYLVRCDKAEMKVYCRYNPSLSPECVVRWLD